MGSEAMDTARVTEFCRSAANVLEPVKVVCGLVMGLVLKTRLFSDQRVRVSSDSKAGPFLVRIGPALTNL